MKDPEFLHFLHKQLLGFVPDHLRDGYEAILANAMDKEPAEKSPKLPKAEKTKKTRAKVGVAVGEVVASLPKQFSAADVIKLMPEAATASVYSALHTMAAKGKLAKVKVSRQDGPPKNMYQKKEVADAQ